MGTPGVFIDRDGTINEDYGYIGDPDRLRLIEGAAAAIKRLNDAGVPVVVITNQSGVARGYYTEEDLHRVNDRLVELLALEGASIDGLYYCPHHPEQGCECRKPGRGLVDKAAEELDIDLDTSFIVGDKVSDVELAENVGAAAILVLTGKGRTEREKLTGELHAVAEDVSEAVTLILAALKKPRG